MLKKFLKSVWNRYKRFIFRFIHLKNSREFQNQKDRKKIVLLAAPCHGNIGDQAIACAEIQFLKERFSYMPLLEITEQEYVYYEQDLNEFITEQDIIIIPGGGFIGTLWQREEDIVLSILEKFKNNAIIIFPQTVFFEDTNYGRAELEKLKEVILGCKNLTVFMREKNSYDYMRTHLKDVKSIFHLVPDIVTYLKRELQYEKEKKVLFCMRKDKEKTVDEKTVSLLKEIIVSMGYKIEETGTIKKFYRYWGNEKKRNAIVNKKIEEFSTAQLVITDRLHGMLLTAIGSTPCIAFDNISHKVSGGYEWLKHLNYVMITDINSVNRDTITTMLRIDKCQYSNNELTEYYDYMEEVIGRTINK